MLSKYLLAGMILCTTLSLAPSPALGFALADRGTVTILIKTSFPDTSLQAIVSREPGAAGHDVIAIRRSQLSPELLFATLEALRRSKARHGEQPQHQVNIRFMRVHDLPALAPADHARMRAMLQQLDNTKERKVPRIKGLVRSIEVSLT